MNPMQLPDALDDDRIEPVSCRLPRPSIPSGLLAACYDMAARLRELDEEFALADFDQDRVDALRRAIAEGQFVIDPGAIADGLLRTVVPFRRQN